MPIPVVVVDDEETDRLIAHKRVARSQWADVLTPILESSSGDAFLDGVFQSDSLPPGQKLILMDINMPGRNGFETIEEMGRLMADKVDEGLVIMMFTSSENEQDIARAKALDLVRGYIVKPIDDADILEIAQIFGLEQPEVPPDGTMLH